MPSLSELQRGFAAATLFGERAALSALGIVAGGLDAAARLAIYRNNVLGNYRKALGATYPVVRALVGAAFFGAAIEAFVHAHPSTRGDVNRYGGELARFLATYPPARSLPYLPDVARLEWAIDQAGIAADAPHLDLAALAAVPLDELSRLHFRLHPSARLLVSPYPVFSIWQVHQAGHEDERVDLGAGGDALLVLRVASTVGVERLSRGCHAFLLALGHNLALADAVDHAVAADAAFQLGEALKRHVAAGAIVAFSAPRVAFV